MKFMHFRASCSYAALAMLLEKRGIDTEDRDIALEIKLPWLFSGENGIFAAGPMLQGAKWFDLWLEPRGLRMNETALEPDALLPYLGEHAPVMLGLRTEQGKHAVVFERYGDGRFHFLNPVRAGSGEPASLCLGAEELLSRVEPPVVVGGLVPAAPRQPELRPLLESSIAALRENRAQIETFAASVHAPNEYDAALDRLFRPLLLDGITMLELAGETETARGFSELQSALLAFLRTPRDIPLCGAFPTERLRELTETYVRLIEGQIAALRPAP